MNRPVVSVVIPVHNAARDLLEQLAAVSASLEHVPGAEIVVVDNRSSDGSGDMARQWSIESTAEVRVVRADLKPGEPYARNVGWREAEGDLILFCDADDVVSRDWAPSLVAGLSTAPFVTGPMDTRELNPSWMARVRGDVFDQMPRLYDVVPYAHGCNMGFRRSVLEQLEGFDESYLIACDLEIAVRAWRAGIELGFEPSAVVHYRLREDLAATYRQGRSYGRYRHRIAALVPEMVKPRAERLATARRATWLVRRAPMAVIDRSVRARWIWVLSQQVGEFQGRVWGVPQ